MAGGCLRTGIHYGKALRNLGAGWGLIHMTSAPGFVNELDPEEK